MSALAKTDIDIATRGADQFIRLYYAAYDSKERLDSLPKFYRSTSSVVWNGNPVQGDDGIKKLLQTMPNSKHEIQSFDCHPIPNTSPPSLLVTVCGTIMHGKAAESTRPVTSKVIDDQPRIFAQTFMLTPETDSPQPPADGTSAQVKYFVNTDDLRFVG